MELFRRIAAGSQMNRTLICGVLLLVSHASADAGDLTGKERSDFIGTGMVTCVRAQKANAVNQVSITDKQIRQYCECMMTMLADHITFDELKYMNVNRDIPPSLQQKMRDATADCPLE
jgi:hypothetical protein